MVTTYLTQWHYTALAVGIIVFILGMFLAYIQKNRQTAIILAITFLLLSTLGTMAAFNTIDTKIKKLKLFHEEHFRILSLEKIIFTGAIENSGKYPIGQITYKVRMTNHRLKFTTQDAGSSFQSKSFLDYFRPNNTLESKAQSFEKEFVVATNLRPGEITYFHVEMSFPPYFEDTTYETSAFGR